MQSEEERERASAGEERMDLDQLKVRTVLEVLLLFFTLTTAGMRCMTGGSGENEGTDTPSRERSGGCSQCRSCCLRGIQSPQSRSQARGVHAFPPNRSAMVLMHMRLVFV